jgi:hypothetical protein
VLWCVVMRRVLCVGCWVLCVVCYVLRGREVKKIDESSGKMKRADELKRAEDSRRAEEIRRMLKRVETNRRDLNTKAEESGRDLEEKS